MKRFYLANLKKTKVFVFALSLLLLPASTLFAQTVTPYPTPGTYTFTVPVGVFSVTVSTWGGGGAGGGVNSLTKAGGGGEGGSFVRGTINVVPGATYTVVVGNGGTGASSANGGSGAASSFSVSGGGATLFNAIGGVGGNAGTNTINFGVGGNASNSGNIVSGSTTSNFYGGNGGTATNASSASSGGGGGSAGAGGNGGNGGSPLTAGAAGAGSGVPADAGVAGSAGRGSANDGNGLDASSPGAGGSGGRAANAGVGPYRGGNGGNGQIILIYTPLTYKSIITSVSAASTAPWCPGESRNVQVTIKNNGTATWTDGTGGTPTINVGVKWNLNGLNWADYYIRVTAGNLAPGATATYTLPLTASNNTGSGYTTPLASGTNNLIFDVVYEGVSWFGDNGGGVGPGNSKSSTVVTINSSTAITTQPSTATQTICQGSASTALSVVATGTALTYQWFSNPTASNSGGTIISGAITSSYTPLTTTVGTLYYYCVVSGSCTPVATSNVSGAVIVNPRPTAVLSGTQSICNGGSATLSLAVTGSGTISGTLSDGTAFSGTAPTITVAVSPSATTTYTILTLTNGCVSITGDKTGTATVTVNPRPTAVLSGTQAICNGSSATLSLAVSGSGTISGTLSDGTAFSGTAPTITLAVSPSATTSYTIATLTNGCISIAADKTGSAIVTVNSPVVITTQPSPTPQTICASFPAGFTVAASGDITGYQWYLGATALADNGNITGTQTATLNINQVASTDAGLYHVVVKGTAPCADVTSANATLIVNQDIIINTQPVPQTLCVGNTATFSISATGTALTYQWRKNGVNLTDGGNISGALTTTLSIANITAADAANYSVVASDGVSGCPNVNSTNAALTVNATSVGGATAGTNSVCPGSNSGTVSLGTHTGTIINWESSTDGSTWTTVSPANTTASLTYTNLTQTTWYRAIVQSGVCPSSSSASTTITVNAITIIGTQPLGATYCQNSTATALSVAASGTGTLTYKWYSNIANNNTTGTLISGATLATYTPSTVTAGTLYYYAIATGTCGTATSNTATILINAATTIGAQPSGATYCQNAAATALSIAASGTGTLTYQWYSNATNNNTTGIIISGATLATYTPSTVTAGTLYYYAIVTGTCGTATSSTAAVLINATTIISTQPSGATYCQNGTATSLNVAASGTGTLTYKWYSNISNNNTTGTLISGATLATYTPSTVTAGTLYYYAIATGTCGTATSNTATILINPATTIGTQPAGASYCQNASATALSVAASGTGTLTYKWYSNATNNNTTGTVISGATLSTYTPSTVTAGTLYYYAIVTGTCSIVTSNTAPIIINATTIIGTQPAGATYCQAASATALSVAASGTGTLTYQWYSNATNNNTTGSAVSGATSATYTPLTGTAGTIYYYAIVTGTCGTATSNTATVAVNATPTASAGPAIVSCTVPITMTGATATGTYSSVAWSGGTGLGTFSGTGTDPSTYVFTPSVSQGSFTATLTVTGASPCTTNPASTRTITWGFPGAWLGITSTDWFTASNWCGGVPIATSDVTIPLGGTVPNQPTIGAVGAVCRNITLNGTLGITGTNNLDVYGDFINNGTFTANTSSVTFRGGTNNILGGSSTTTFYNLTINKAATGNTLTSITKAFTASHNLTVTQGDLILQATNANYTVSNDITVSANGILTHSVDWATGFLLSVGGSITIDGIFNYTARSHVQMNSVTGETVRTGANAASGFSILTLQNGIFTANGPVKINDNFWAMFGTTGTFHTSIYPVTALSALLINGGAVYIDGAGGSLNVTGGIQVGYAGGLVSAINLSAGTLNTDGINLGIAAAAPICTFTHSGGIANINGALLIDLSGVYTCTGTPTINITGNWTNNKTFTAAGSQVNFNGTATQTIGGAVATTFNNLAISNAAGITLAANATVNTTLNLSSGLVTTNALTLTSATAGTITNVPASYVNGKLARGFGTGAGSKFFPIGKGGNYRPLTFAYTASGAVSTITAEQFESTLSGTVTPATVTKDTRYWEITKTGTGTVNYTVTLDPSYTPSPAGTLVQIIKKEGTSTALTATAATTPNYTNGVSFTTFNGSSTASGTNDFALGSDCSSSANAGSALAAICQGGTSAALGGSIGGTATGGTWTDGGAGGTFNPTANTLNATWTPPAAYFGTATLTLTPTGGICAPNTASSKNIVVNGNSTIALSSAAGTDGQTKCINIPVTAITYAIGGGATGASITTGALPAGVSGIYNSGTKIFTISGTPTVSGSFNYTVTTSGPCINLSLSGTITVTPDATITLSSAGGTDAQTVCLNSGITNITYAIGGSGSSAAVTGLPAGVAGIYSGGIFTISGTPSVSGTFNYSVITTGPCVKPTATGTIVVNILPTGTFTETETSGTANDSTICAGATVTFKLTPSTYGSYIFRVNGVTKQSGTSNIFSSALLNNGDNVTVDVANGLNCGATFGPIVITVITAPTATLSATENSGTPNDNTICIGDNITFTGGGGTAYNFKVNGSSVQSGASNTYSTTTLAVGSSSVTVDVSNSNGCITTSAPKVITVNSLPTGTLTPSATTICAGGNITFVASGSYSTYEFKVNGTTVQGPSASNTYSTTTLTNGQVVTVIAAISGGCSGTFNPVPITVNAPPNGTITTTENSGIANDYTICEGAPVTFTATPGFTNYQFYIRNTSTLLQGGSSNVYTSTTLISGDYVTVVVSNGCTNTLPQSATITVAPLPMGTLSASPSSTICNGDNVTFTATANPLYSYTFQVNGATVQSGPSNVFSSNSLVNGDKVTVDVTGSNNCVSTFGPVTMTVNPLPTGILVPVENSGSTANDGIICTGSTVVFTAPTGFIHYDFILNGATVAGGSSNTYSNSTLTNGDKVQVAVTNATGCIGLLNMDTITVNPLPVVASLTGTLSMCLNSSTTLSDATAGGVWSSLNTAVATVDAAGVVTGISAGTATISYTVSNSITGCSNSVSAVVTVNAPPAVTPIAGNLNDCVGGNSQLSDATASGVWSSNNIPVATVNSAGLVTGVSAGTATISYTVTDVNGCTTTVTTNVTVSTALVVAPITGAASVCENNTTTLSDATSGGLWSSSNTAVATINASSGVVTGLSSGTTTIVYSVTDACSNAQTNSVVFTVNPAAAVVITNPLAVCSPSTVDLTSAAITSGSSAGLTFTYWTNAAATISYSTPATAGSGTYYIKGTTSAGCFDIKPVTVTVNPAPTVTITNPAPACSPATVDLTLPSVTAGSTPGLTYTYWTDAAATTAYSTPATAGTGTYYIKGTSAAGCFIVKPVTVSVNPVPTVLITNPAAICSPSTADLTAAAVTAGSTAGLTFTYFTDAAATITYSTPATAGSGTYYVKGTTVAGCFNIKPVSVTVNPKPSVLITNPSTVCAPSTVNITLTAVTAGSTTGLTFTYFTDAAGTIVYNTPTTAGGGTYYIKGTLATGCYDIKPVVVTVNPKPTVAITNPAAVCSPATADITLAAVTAGSTSGLTFSYFTNAAGTIVYNTPTTAGTGTYYIKGSTAGGCADIQPVTVTVNTPPAVPTITPSTFTMCQGSILPLTSGISASTSNATFSSGAINLGIPDYPSNVGAASTIPVSGIPAGAVINSVSVNFNITHTYDADLRINLKAPNNNVLNLVNSEGGGGDNFGTTTINTIISSNGTTTIIGGSAPFIAGNPYSAEAQNNVAGATAITGNTSNVTAFASLFSTPNGNWIFSARDIGTGDVGTINNWSITINYTTSAVPQAVTWSPVTDLYTDAGATTAYTGQSLATVYTKPATSGSVVYTATATNASNCNNSANVTLTVNPVPVVTIFADYCVVAGKVRLTASSTPAGTYIWSTGQTGTSIDVDIADDYSVVASIGTGCSTTATISVAQELVVNGDFSAGNTGFISPALGANQYHYRADIAGNNELLPEGLYGIGADGQNYHPSFWGHDHTTGTGNYMIVNGFPNGNPQPIVWQETVNVLPNTVYYFSAWGMSLNNVGPFAQLQFNVNGTQVGSAAVLAAGVNSNSNNGWTRFYGTLTTGPTTTTAIISITDLQNAPGGNDFGLDDISFATLSTFVQLVSAPGTDAQTPCINTPITPIVYSVGSTASGPTITGLPPGVTGTFNGVLFTISGTPTVAGDYTYTVTTTGSCLPTSATGTIKVQVQTIALTSGSSAPVCINTSVPATAYTIGGSGTGASVTSGALPAGVSGVYNAASKTFNITGNPTTAGIFNYTVTTSGTCTPATINGTITVQAQTITLNSANNTQTVCINSPIANIQYTVAGTATGASVSGLPAGVTGTFNSGLFIISGSPAGSAGSPYNYTVTTSGPCAAVVATGTITVTPAATIILTSGTNPQLACKGTAFSMAYTVSNATGAFITLGTLPSGVTSAFSGGVFTISGTPTVGGTFNYTITTAGGCGSATITGTITVQTQTISLTSGTASPSVCINAPMANIVYTLGGTATGASVSGLPTGVGYTVVGNNITISGTPTVSGPALTYTITTSGTCGTITATGTITVQPAAIGGTLTSLSICSGGSGSLSVTGQTGTIVRWEYSTDGGTTWTPVANTTISLTYPALTAARLYRVVVGNGCGNVFSSVAVVGIHNLWTGSASTDWNTAGNWSDNQVPTTSCPLVYIPNTVNKPILSSGTAIINNIQISSGATLTVNGTGSLKIAGTISNSGIFDASLGSIEFNGTSSQTIAAGTFQGNAINDLIITNTAGVTLGGATDVYRSLTYGITNSTLNTGGFLTLKSSAAQTAWIGNMTGHIINGDVTVERYIATGTSHAKSWQLLAVPTTGQTIKQSWQEGATATNVSAHAAGSAGNPNAGYGTMLTSDVPNATMQSTPGFDAATAPGPSIKVYNSATNGYNGPASTGLPVYNPKGYFILVRGDRSVYTGTGMANPTVLRTKGTLFTPANLPPSTTVLAGKQESVGNPYASAIDLRKLTLDAGVNTSVIVWDPTIGGTVNGLGAFQTLYLNGDGTNNGTNNYVNLLTSAAYGSAGTINNNIQSGQAFIIQALPAINGSLSFTENAKANNSKLLFRPQAPTDDKTPELRTNLYGVNASGSFLADGMLIQYNDNYSNSIDGLDARKMGNTAENLAIRTSGKLLTIERRHTITQQDTIFLNLTGVKVQAYHFEFIASNLDAGLQGFFEDNYMHTRTALAINGTTIANFTIENVAGSYANDRFRIVFAPAVVLPVTFTSVKAYLQDKNVSVEWKVENEMNIKQYEVEKSTNGTQFTTFTIKPATANGGRSAVYVATDANPLAGYNYYRVKSVDMDGKMAYTTVVKVLMGSIKQDITIYPNPITDGMIHLQLMNQPAGRYGIRLLNKIGQVIVSRQISHAEGSSTELIKWDFNLAHGMYELEVTQPGGTQKNINVIY